MVTIKLEQFEGPFALLVQLIDKAELDITQVSLATVADQYIAYLKSLTELDPEATADFLVVASRLLLIKSKALLPYLLPEEEAAIDELEQQLKMYKEYFEATKRLEEMVGAKHFMFGREYNRKALLANLQIFAPPAGLQAKDLRNLCLEIINELKPPAPALPEERLTAVVSIEERIAYIADNLQKAIKSRFSELLAGASNKVEIVVSFLAMLELVKQRTIVAEQDDLFGEIELEHIT